MRKIRIGLYGTVGHQIQNAFEAHPEAEVVALASFEPSAIPDYLRRGGVVIYASLDELLADQSIDMVSFCSPFKDEQGEHVIRCMESGKHAYAEKPCCMDEATLDRIIETAKRTGRIFHEMGGTAMQQPYCTLREIVASGEIGEVIQVFGQKSYPWADWRPSDERIDGGLALQVGIYNARFAEHVAGVRISDLEIRETRLGNTNPDSECRRAVSMLMEFENGGVGSAVANYCCPDQSAWGNWGYETLRIFGSKGFVESIDNGRIGTLAVEGCKPQVLDFSASGGDYLESFLLEIKTGMKAIPYSLEDELRPTRWVIRARENNRRREEAKLS
ncbi:Gfo/Idh/MocA family oxidoreductase [Rubellicoccus peritrichatus]|uniref:Gfo/Idh/MocA family oxidoreductase n=1 Tax=Rubellicoccus peritrichatus TaxID=3080537 RepID=A0AAQ3LGK9_9BACT|nr:Gfo/Idh/MocA family oxidoreductase [Puniceicoccus sp. CR14]WOO43438.1 Gfo/Idh/MocA family oxidoreductase [Puniceicoccus sp. CR14]